MRNVGLIGLTLIALSTAGAQQKHTITFDDFAAIRTVSDPQVSPDGKSALYAVRTVDVAANRRTARTYMVPLAGGIPQLFPSPDVAASEARWSPDGKHVSYITGDQLWISDASGANPRSIM